MVKKRHWDRGGGSSFACGAPKPAEITGGAPKRIDVRGLRRVENQMQKWGALIDIVVEDAVPGWGFFLLALEYRGVGSSFICGAPNRGEIIDLCRRQGRRLEANVASPGVMISNCPGHPEAIQEHQVERLTDLVPELVETLRRAMPRGWGFGLMIYARRSDQVVYVSTGEREDMATALLEFAHRMEAGEIRAPGVVGTAH